MKKRQTILYLLIGLAILGIAILLFFLLPGSASNTVPVVLPTATPDLHGDAGDGNADSETQIVSINADNVCIVLQTLSRADSYSRLLTVENFWSGGSSRQTIDVSAHSGSVKMVIDTEGQESRKHILISGEEKWIWYSDSETVFRGGAALSEADRFQTLIDYTEILSLDRSSILEAGHDLHEDQLCVYVRYIAGDFGYEHRAWISLTSGLLLAQESYDGQELIYRMSSTIPDLSTPDDSIFLPPET